MPCVAPVVRPEGLTPNGSTQRSTRSPKETIRKGPEERDQVHGRKLVKRTQPTHAKPKQWARTNSRAVPPRSTSAAANQWYAGQAERSRVDICRRSDRTPAAPTHRSRPPPLQPLPMLPRSTPLTNHDTKGARESRLQSSLPTKQPSQTVVPTGAAAPSPRVGQQLNRSSKACTFPSATPFTQKQHEAQRMRTRR